MRAMSATRWARIRAGYEGGESVSSLSRKFRVSRNAVYRHRAAESWALTQQGLEQVIRRPVTPQEYNQAARGRAIVIATERALTQPGTVAAIGDLTIILRRQNAIADSLTKLAEELVSGVASGEIVHDAKSSRAALLSEVVVMCSLVQSYTRTAAGLKIGQSSELDATKKILGKRFTIVTTPPPPERDNYVAS